MVILFNYVVVVFAVIVIAAIIIHILTLSVPVITSCMWFDPVTVVSTMNIKSLLIPPTYIDGVYLRENDRILLIGQECLSENGIYIYKNQHLERSSDALYPKQLYAITRLVYVLNGDTYKDMVLVSKVINIYKPFEDEDTLTKEEIKNKNSKYHAITFLPYTPFGRKEGVLKLESNNNTTTIFQNITNQQIDLEKVSKTLKTKNNDEQY